MLNRFLRWLAPKPKSDKDYLFKGSADALSVTVGDYARMAADVHRRVRIDRLKSEIARLKRNKKRHSHLQQELDRLNAL